MHVMLWHDIRNQENKETKKTSAWYYKSEYYKHVTFIVLVLALQSLRNVFADPTK